MKEKVSALAEHDLAYLEEMRNWLRGHFKEGEQGKYNDLGGKLAVIGSILQNNWFDRNEAWQLQALGVGLGDALAQQLGMTWVIVEDDHGRMPVLNLPGTSLKIYALTMIEKRVHQDESFDAVSLFEALCHQIEEIRAPKRSFLGRLFGPRLT